MLPFDQEFVISPTAELPYERDFSAWLGEATLSTVVWSVENEDLIQVFNDSIVAGGKIARVWIRAKGIEGLCRVYCAVTTSDVRKDSRTWEFMIRKR
jgi:hypothetical protein